jgi:hypothetical protein
LSGSDTPFAQLDLSNAQFELIAALALANIKNPTEAFKCLPAEDADFVRPDGSFGYSRPRPRNQLLNFSSNPVDYALRHSGLPEGEIRTTRADLESLARHNLISLHSDLQGLIDVVHVVPRRAMPAAVWFEGRQSKLQEEEALRKSKRRPKP